MICWTELITTYVNAVRVNNYRWIGNGMEWRTSIFTSNLEKGKNEKYNAITHISHLCFMYENFWRFIFLNWLFVLPFLLVTLLKFVHVSFIHSFILESRSRIKQSMNKNQTIHLNHSRRILILQYLYPFSISPLVIY